MAWYSKKNYSSKKASHAYWMSYGAKLQKSGGRDFLNRLYKRSDAYGKASKDGVRRADIELAKRQKF